MQLAFGLAGAYLAPAGYAALGWGIAPMIGSALVKDTGEIVVTEAKCPSSTS